MQTAIVMLIVALAAGYLLRSLYLRLFKPAQPVCGCGCSGCTAQHECSAPEKNSSKPTGPDPA